MFLLSFTTSSWCTDQIMIRSWHMIADLAELQVEKPNMAFPGVGWTLRNVSKSFDDYSIEIIYIE